VRERVGKDREEEKEPYVRAIPLKDVNEPVHIVEEPSLDALVVLSDQMGRVPIGVKEMKSWDGRWRELWFYHTKRIERLSSRAEYGEEEWACMEQLTRLDDRCQGGVEGLLGLEREGGRSVDERVEFRRELGEELFVRGGHGSEG
jgi:hypothetical protein